MWTKEILQDLIQTQLRDHQLILVANRQPYSHRFVGGRIECVPPAAGLVSALDPIMRACGGTWIAHGSGDADRVTTDADGRLQVPPDHPDYTLRRVWLTREQEDGYYYGLANEGLWPLCHRVFRRPVFDSRNWATYREVNELFARAVLEEAGGREAFVFVQDYHFALLPQMLKRENPNLIVAQFWHIPWPNHAIFEVFPWKEELLEGLLGNDLLGFHLRAHCLNFMNTADRNLEARVDREQFEISRAGKSTVVRPFPISIDFDEHEAMAQSPAVDRMMNRWREELRLGDVEVGIGIDRIDYTKGIPERFRALDRLFENQSDLRNRLIFIQIGVPSRSGISEYRQLDEEIERLVVEINQRWGDDNWQPIIYLKKLHGPTEMMALHRLARFCIVSSLDDGMNLVAKEFVASRQDEDGVLVLSRYTGAARELTSATLVNPFAIDEMASAIFQSLRMPEEERRKRMRKMRTAVAENNIYRWAGKLLSALMRVEVTPNEAVGAGAGTNGFRSGYEEVVD